MENNNQQNKFGGLLLGLGLAAGLALYSHFKNKKRESVVIEVQPQEAPVEPIEKKEE